MRQRLDPHLRESGLVEHLQGLPLAPQGPEARAAGGEDTAMQ